MTKEKSHSSESRPDAAQDAITSAASTDDPATASDPAGAAPAEAEDPIIVAMREAAELRDKMLRTLAEMENLRKRTEREVADARIYGIAAFARDMLDIADNIRRALDAVPAAAGEGDSGLKTLVEGVELTERALLKSLEKNGVRRFDPNGEKFNPNLHQAMYEVPDGTVAPGTVVQVIQAGFMIGERVLRPALVAVAKAVPKTNEQADSGSQTI
jgi:molecular chaperone GrpE